MSLYERDHSDREEERDLPGVLRKVLLMRKMLQQLRALQVMVRVTGEVVDKYDKDTDIDNDNDFSEFIVCLVKSLLTLLVQQGPEELYGLSSVGYSAYLIYIDV